MKKYRIFDMRGGLMGKDNIIYANSPKEAVEKIYPNANVKRCREHTSDWAKVNVVVNNTYCYAVSER